MPGPTPTKREALSDRRARPSRGRPADRATFLRDARRGPAIGGERGRRPISRSPRGVGGVRARRAPRLGTASNVRPSTSRSTSAGSNGVNVDALAEASSRTARRSAPATLRGRTRRWSRPSARFPRIGGSSLRSRAAARSACASAPSSAARRPVPSRRRAPARPPGVRGRRARAARRLQSQNGIATTDRREGANMDTDVLRATAGATGRARQGHPRGRREHRHDQEAVRLDRRGVHRGATGAPTATCCSRPRGSASTSAA